MRKELLVPEQTLKRQAKASDPRNSAWVTANAGSGKTHVLALRVIRLLLDGTEPSKILCLTYTRAAAANMSNRVFKNLAEWTALDDAALGKAIEAIDGSRPDAARLSRARRLFAEALETPGGLKIQTIHAFCEAVLHQFPLEANIAAHFQLLDGQMEAALVAEARRDMLTGVVAADNSALADAFGTVLQQGGEAGLDSLLSEIVAQRNGLRRFITQVRGHDPKFGDLHREFGFTPGQRPEDLAGSLWPDPYFNLSLGESFGRRAIAAGKAKAQDFATALTTACGHSDPLKRLDCLRDTFLVKKQGSGWQARSTTQIASKGVAEHFPGFADHFARLAERVLELHDKIALLRMLEGTRAALTVADWLIARYEQLKTGRGFLDFSDLIDRTVRLLQRQDAGPWVQYKLDRGIDHILIDEAQDTSPDQWSVVKQLAGEFFAGLGARDDPVRTIFAVGDEKQSIYSFQGAVPESFAQTGTDLQVRVRAAARKFERVQLTWSFRSTQDVLEAVDRVFWEKAARRNISADTSPPSHKAIRAGEAGYVELWPPVPPTAVDEPEDWADPIDHASAPAVQVADRVARTIAGWIAHEDILEGRGRAVVAGDIMVLVRKRDRFVHALSRKLKDLGVAVAGADRLSLPAHIAVRDLAALGHVLLQPEDDLSLAAVLKSPIFGVAEEALMDLAIGRSDSVSLHARLRHRAETDPALKAVADQLENWTNEAAFRPVFEFYATLLSRDRVRSRMIARLGPEAGDILDEFLNFCLAEERAGLPGLEAFLATLESAGPDIKREMDQTRQEVRILTVHAAKGLEAPVVFLVDSGGAPFHDQHLPRLLPFEGRNGLWSGKGYLWRSAAEIANGVSQQAAALFRDKADDEYRRLLYVGMTRAEDRLIVCGYEGKRGAGGNTWHALVSRALIGAKETTERPNPVVAGETVHRFRVSPDALPLSFPVAPKTAKQAAHVPDFVGAVLLPAEPLPRPLAPSGATALIEAGAEPAVDLRSPVLDPEAEPSFAIRRGTVLHKLLQVLPDVAEAERRTAGMRYLARAAADWKQHERDDALNSALAVLDNAEFGAVFAPGSRAEVAIMGRLTIQGRERAVSGKIDRLAVSPEALVIVDYKTNRPAPLGLPDVPQAYVLQLALYRALLQPLYRGRAVGAALLFTEAPRLIAVPEAVLDAALARLGRAWDNAA